MAPPLKTERATPSSPPAVPRLRVRVTAGFDAGAQAASDEARVLIGTSADATLRLTDPTVSRYHAELEVTPEGVILRDLGSTNGTLLGAAAVREALLRGPAELQLGRTRLEVNVADEQVPLGLSGADAFGELIGASVAMRQVYATLERAAPTASSVLITGESGTGKELAARGLHDASPRRDGPFEVVDCGGLPATLIEAELFGHEKGAFTGAAANRTGAFERADGGTVFLDEIGELPLELQPKLLRVLAEREVRRVGGGRTSKVDVRVVAATNRDLRREVNAGRFRADLFYRLAVIQVRMPPLRARLDDLPSLVPALVAQLRRERGLGADVTLDEAAWGELAGHQWPGNVRELRNWVEQCLVLRAPPSLTPDTEGTEETEGAPEPEAPRASLPPPPGDLTGTPLKVARERFERTYLAALLAETGGNVSEAARRAGVDRVTLFRMMRRYGLRRED
ncbi:MAG: sigma 54-interacting transcriptional regulator [Polyangiales bacterium]